jgi:hypothetical protein
MCVAGFLSFSSLGVSYRRTETLLGYTEVNAVQEAVDFIFQQK